MNGRKAKNALAEGLRALELLARLAPVGVEAYAKAGQFEIDRANALIAIFESGGYVKRLPRGNLYVLQPVAAKIVSARHHPRTAPTVSVH